MSHHWLMQPRDWHGRWTTEGGVDPRRDGIPERCYHSDTYGDSGQYIDGLGDMLNGNLTCDDLNDQVQDAMAQSDDARAEANQIRDEVWPTLDASEDLFAVGASIVAGAVAGIAIGGLTGGLSLPASAFLLALAADAAGPIAGALAASATLNLLTPESRAIPPEQEQQVANALNDYFLDVLTGYAEGEDLSTAITNQLDNIPDIAGLPAQDIQNTFVATMHSYARSQSRYYANTLSQTYLTLADDCARMADDPEYRQTLERRHEQMANRYRQECSGA